MNLAQIAALVKGNVEGDAAVVVRGLNGIDTAGPGDLTFAMDDALLAAAEKTNAAAILTTTTTKRSAKPLIRVANPKLAFLAIYNAFVKQESRGSFTHPTAQVAPSAKIGTNVWIGAYTVVGDEATIGDGTIIENHVSIGRRAAIGTSCHLYPQVTIYAQMRLGNNVILHSGTVIGADGFGYVKEGGVIHKFPQLGRVIIEDNVEIGANTTIDRGALNNTIIGAGSKIDNLCQIAHNVQIGKNVIIAAQTGISGSTVVRDNVMMGGQVGVADNLTINENVIVGAQSGIIGDIKKGEVVWGTPARPAAQAKRQMAVTAWLTKNFKLITKLVK